MFVVMKLARFEFETATSMPIVFGGKEIGYLPVFSTREEALEAYPESELKEIEFIPADESDDRKRLTTM